MAIEPVKVPQNVYVEDHIIGPITLRHLVILGIGSGISYFIWVLVNSANIIIQVFCWTPLAIAAAFAFVKINDISLFRIILLMIEQSGKPNVRYWTPHSGISVNIITKPTSKELQPEQEKILGESKLVELTQKLEEERRELATEDAEMLLEEQRTKESLQKELMPVNKFRVVANKKDTDASVDGISHPRR